jgi:filamentous hemagglutinin family protein
MKRSIDDFGVMNSVSPGTGKSPEIASVAKPKKSIGRWCQGFYSGIVLALGIGGAIVFSVNQTLAQITPDATLGGEGSLVTPNVNVRGLPADRIDGGAARGASLFHSFSQFNIFEGQRVYFANPSGIENILTRVTGSNISHILGTLGVDGSASLFLLNPNGIIFGPNAQLDIAGSFLASTAESVVFSNGFEFTAKNPQAPPLLTVSVPLGVQYGTNHSAATIANVGKLAVGQNLTLAADKLDLQGQLYAGENLTLQAQDTLRVRDSTANPFIAAAIGRLLVQGNQQVDIFALNHMGSGFFSNQDIVLRSANPVGGDAHYWSGGNFRIEQLDGKLGYLSSPYDPIIRSLGNVSFDAYLGTSLHILAGGSVTIGTVIITGPETGTAGNDFIQETVTLSNGTQLLINGSTRPTLDIRAGLSQVNTPGTTGVNFVNFAQGDFFLNPGLAFVPTTTTSPIGGDITLDAVSINAPNGLVFLNGNNITVTEAGTFGINGINVSGTGGNSGSVIIDARNTINLRGSSIITQSDTANAGNVTLLAKNQVSLTNGFAIVTDTSGSGKAGDINIDSGSVTLTNGSQLIARAFGNGDGGKVTIAADNAVQFTGTSTTGFPSGIFTDITGASRGGDVEINAGSVSIRDGAQVYARALGTGDGGDLTVNATDFIELIGDSAAAFPTLLGTNVTSGASGNGGDVKITTGRLILQNGARVQAVTSGTGKAGNIIIDAPESITMSGEGAAGTNKITTQSTPSATGNAGDLQINTGQLILQNGSQIDSSTFSAGQGGNLTINALESVELIGTSANGTTASNLGVNAVGTSSNAGDGGVLRIDTKRLIVRDGAQVGAGTFGTGNGGTLAVNASESVEVSGSGPMASSSIFAAATPGSTGNAGRLQIDTGRLLVQDRATISATTESSGMGGNLDINARELIIRGGARVIASTYDGGQGGTLKVKASESVEVSGSSADNSRASLLSTQSLGTGKAGDLSIDTKQLLVLNGGQIDSSTFSDGQGGNLGIKASQSVELIGTSNDGTRASNLGVNAVGAGVNAGDGGTLTIDTKRLSIRDGAQVGAGTFGPGNGGTLEVNASELEVIGRGSRAPSALFISASASSTGNVGDLKISSERLVIQDGAEIDASTSGKGSAGNLLIHNADSITLSNGSISTSVNASAVVNKVQGNQRGNIDIQTRSLSLTNGASVSAKTSGQGDAGNISVRNANAIFLSNSAISTAVNQGAVGQGGNIELQTDSLSLIDNAQVSAATSGQGDAGSIIVPNANSVFLSGSAISTASSSAGASGDVAINTQKLTLEQGASISASTVSSAGGNITLNDLDTLQVRNSLISASTQTGTAGKVSVTATDSVELSGTLADGKPGGLLAEATQGGNASSLNITTAQLIISDGAQATVSSTGTGKSGNLEVSARKVQLDNQAKLTAETQAGVGGNITLTGLDTLKVNNSLISASTQTGTAGNLSVNAKDSVELRDTGGLSVEATNGGTAGNLTVHTKDMSVNDGAKVTVSSPTGVAGNLNISANNLLLNRGTLSAETGTSGAQSGANITLSGLDLLLMRNESLISANATGNANGGNIIIESQFIVALPPQGRQGSDIVANAVRGNGGRVNITTSGLFGIEFRPIRTPKNDITASSEFGIAGEVIINKLVVDPSQGLDALPQSLVDVEGLINQDLCKSARTGSAFTVTGRGGTPENPKEILSPEATVVEWATPEGTQQGSNGQPQSSNLPYPYPTPLGNATRTVSPPEYGERYANGFSSGVQPSNIQPLTPKGQLVEAQGWIIDADGKVILTANPPSAIPQKPGLFFPNCQSRY